MSAQRRMENISRDLRRRLKQPGSGAREKRRGRWTLLFVEDRGKVISLENIKGMMIAVILFLAAVTAAAAGFFFLYNRSEDRNTKLQKALMDSEQRAIPLRNEKDVLMARLVVAEAQIEMLHSRNGSSKGEDAGGVLTGGPPPDEKARKSFVQPEKRESVTIEKVKIFYDPGAGTMETEFRLTNILGTGEPVSGFILNIRDLLSSDKVRIYREKPSGS